MTEAIEPSLLHLIRHTPMRDVLRGQLTGRLDYHARVDSTDLPQPAKDLVKRIVRRTRLWPLERVDVADDLVAHFSDGLASGATVEELIEAFGDQRQAARLIRSAKRRQRPLAWHVLRAIGWCALIVLAIYAALALRFLTGKPSPDTDYLSALNLPAAAAKENDRAWPLYRQALLAFGSRTSAEKRALNELLAASPGSPDWPKLIEWLEAHRDAIDVAISAAGRDQLGFVLGPGGSAYDPQLWPDRKPGMQPDHPNADMLLSVLLPHLEEMSRLSGVLGADAQLAVERGDRARFLQSADAIMGIADQLRSIYIIGGVTSIAVRNVALDSIMLALQSAPAMLRDDDLQYLAHRLAGPRVAADLVNVDGERLVFYDAIQRMYTDDGSGDGRLTLEGVRLLRLAYGPQATSKAMVLASANLMASRSEVEAAYDRWVNANVAALQRRLRDLPSVAAGFDPAPASVRYLPVDVFAWSTHSCRVTSEIYLTRRDAVQLGIALELHRRQHGEYPAQLEALVPWLIPQLPLDPITGAPLHYGLVDGRPLIYSVGADRDDDRGRPPLGRAGSPQALAAARWDVLPENAPDGDWVLYSDPPVTDPSPR